MQDKTATAITASLVIALLVAALVVGCPAPRSSETGDLNGPPAPVEGGKPVEIKQFGSTTVLPIAQKWQAAFNQLHPEIHLAVSGGGSGTGISQLAAKTCDIANSSRPIKEEEIQAAATRGVRPHEIPIAYDGIAVIVNRENPLKALSVEQLSGIYTGTLKHWESLGAPGLGSIQALGRDAASGTFESFRTMVVMLADTDRSRDYAADILQLSSNEAILQTVMQGRGAVGYVGLGYVTEQVKVLGVIPLQGTAAVSPSGETVRDGSYPISRRLYMYTDGEPTGPLQTYVEWCLSPAGQKLVQAAGYIPLQPL
jgi:phosphate transport system substrate-binding protein